ncbi:MAG: isopentenyl-diphosphate Delta-isomerase [Micromonosporaceae bacterium]|nr:isopentenyl-diphosphate Delta-isomerase [Micromonosporaceae bacterium]
MSLPQTHASGTTTSPEDPRDDVVLLDEGGRPCGRADRSGAHTSRTPLHLAFSTYLFNRHGEVLITRRALDKKTWPGVWTNSCCGHPRPGETIEDAARRRIREELGLTVGPLIPLLPDFRYLATDASGLVENEICPVFAAFVDDQHPDPDWHEVSEWAWIPWDSLHASVVATPCVYSPWSALQVPLIGLHRPELPPLTAPPPVDVNTALTDVDALLTVELASLRDEWDGYAGGLSLDVLPADLPHWLGDLLLAGGKRLRTTAAYWGYVAAGGTAGDPGYQHVVRAAAALETLHLFALVHDDVMDGSGSRRGRTAAHVEAAMWHAGADGYGDRAAFGRNLAILLGDLAHAVADRLVDRLPRSMREVWYQLSVELIAGQRADLTATAAGRRDRKHAEYLARAKSGRYTIARPLQLGATAAEASPALVAALLEYGDHLGRAFALRDDYLGVWGDPAVTGKPAGDDLLEGKPTVLLCLAAERLRDEDADLLRRVGTPAFTRDDVPALAAAMRAAGVDAGAERLITASVDAALDALPRHGLPAEGLAGLRALAHAAAWRNA